MMGKKSVADVKCSFQYKILSSILETITSSFFHVLFVLFFSILQLCLAPYGVASSNTSADISCQTLQLKRYQPREGLLLALIYFLKKPP